MSDEQTRRLERRYRESGALEDRTAWIRSRLRVGALDERVIRPCAILGDLAARDVMAQDSLGVIAEGPVNSSTRTLMALAALEKPEWALALVASFSLVPDPRRELVAITGAVRTGRDLVSLGKIHGPARFTASFDRSAKWFHGRFCEFLKQEDEDGAWDLFHHLLTQVATLEPPAGPPGSWWEQIAVIVRNELVQALIG